MLKNTETRYGLVSKLLHWTIGLLILGLIWLGWYMVRTDFSYYDPWGPRWLYLHKAFGTAVLLLAVAKLGWQAYSPKPRLDDSIRGWQRVGAYGAHSVLIAMMFAIPVTGYFVSTSEGAPIDFFGLLDIPATISGRPGFRDLCIGTHYCCAYATLALVAGHAGAALKHQFVDRDGTLARMLWR